MKLLALSDLKSEIKNESSLVDVRPTETFVNGFVKGAVNIVINKEFPFRLNHFSPDKKVILIAEDNQVEELKKAIHGFTDKDIFINTNGLDEWKQAVIPLDMIIEVDTYELRLDLQHDPKAMVLDVRNEIDYELMHIAGAYNIPVFDFMDPLVISKLDEGNTIYLHCNGGTRGVLASSILKKHGFHNIRNIQGGMKAIKEEKEIPLKENKAKLN